MESFARDSIEDQVSRSPNDLLRFAALTRKLRDLVRRAPVSADTAIYQSQLSAYAKEAESFQVEALDAAARLRGTSSLTTPKKAAGKPNDAEIAEGAELGPKLLDAARYLVGEVLRPKWEADATAPLPRRARFVFGGARKASSKPEGEKEADKGGDAPQSVDALSPLEGTLDDRFLAWLREAQAFVATVVALLVNRHVRQFRYFLYTLTASALLLLLSLSAYAFEPYRLLLTCIWVIMASVVGAGLWVFVELERNALLSKITGTNPGKVDVTPAFFLRVVSWVIIPLLGVAAAQYPSVASSLFSWIEPFTHALR